MAKRTETTGYRLTIDVDRPLLWTKHAAEKARSDAETIAGEIRKHVGVDFDDAKHVLVMPLIEATCDYCGAAWTEDSTDYNGGCCARDQETHETREAALSSTAPSSQTPVSPPPGGESGGRPVVLTYLAGGLRGEERVVRLKYHGNLVSWLDAEIAKRDRQIATFEARNTALRSDLVAALGRAEKAEADAAVLRDALEAYKQESCSSVVDCLPGCDYDRPVGEKFDLACKRRADALATGAGEKLLAEHKRLQSDWERMRAKMDDHDSARQAEKERADYLQSQVTQLQTANALLGQHEVNRLQAEVTKLRAFVKVFDPRKAYIDEPSRVRQCSWNDLLAARAALDGGEAEAKSLVTGAGEKLQAELEKLRAFVAAWDDYARGFAGVEDGHRLWIAARNARAKLDGGAS